MTTDYITTADFKTYRGITGSSDDSVIGAMVTAASEYIEIAWGYVYAASDTARSFYGEAIHGQVLRFDKTLASITSIVNGDGATITTADYYTPNDAPYYYVTLKPTSTVVWIAYPSPIVVTGKWAYSATPPSRVKQACLIIVNYLYDKRSTGVDADRQIITAEGIILPAGISKSVADLLGAKNIV